jgi:fatty-acid desaturase
MNIINHVLREPSYGWKNNEGEFYRPTRKELFKEFFNRLNIFASKKNWLAFTSWGTLVFLFPFVIIFFVYHFSFTLLLLGFIYGMFIMGTHGTIWYHRYSTHDAYKFRNKFWKFLTRNLVPKMIPEEIYVISHHVHHAKSDCAGDPYNAHGGWLYCFLADANHQPISHNLSEADYEKACFFLKHTGVYCNSYKQYKTWGTISNPWRTFRSIILSVSFWFITFYLLGGFALACALLGGAFFWALGVRTFNYKGHGKGVARHKEGLDFNINDLSINQYMPGIVTGEWHNNHHLFPRSARAGFLKYQIDLAWYYIYFLYKIGGVESYFNSHDKFISDYYNQGRKK